ncbi:MAG: N-acetyltransferase family protein [Candidatus Limnocylindrales bacterium]
MVENVAIQPPTLDDAHAAAALHYQSWVATYTPLLSPDQAARLTHEERAGHWERLLRERPPDRGALVAKRDGALVGLVEWEMGPEGDPTVGEVHAIHVAAEERGRGVGWALLQASVAALRESGVCRAILWVLEANANARAFYERQGWVWDGTRVEHPLGGFEDFPCVVEVRYALDL